MISSRGPSRPATINFLHNLFCLAGIRTTMNIYGDAASAEMREAHGKIVQLALQAT
jgi:hypothetical protein